MTTTNKASRVVFTGTREWWEIVGRDEEVVAADECFPAGWQRAAELAEIDVDDPESWISQVTEVAERHSAIKVGDYACCQGIGSDVIFVRLEI